MKYIIGGSSVAVVGKLGEGGDYWTNVHSHLEGGDGPLPKHYSYCPGGGMMADAPYGGYWSDEDGNPLPDDEQ